MNDLIVYRRNRWFIGLLSSPMTRRIAFFHLLVLMLPAAGVFWLLHLLLDHDGVKRAQLTSEVLLLAQVVEGQLPHRVPVDLMHGDGADLERVFETITLRAGVEAIAFGPRGEQRSLTPGHSLMSHSALASFGAWPAWLGPSSPVLLDHLAAIYAQLLPQGTSSVSQPEGAASVIAAVINAPLSPRKAQSHSIGDQIWVATPIVHRQVMVGGLALGYPANLTDPGGGRMGLELALRLLFAAMGLAIILSVVAAWVMFGPVDRITASMEHFSHQLRHGVGAKTIAKPRLPQRRDSIGRLSEALHNTIGALFIRIREAEAIVGEMAGEITNPMTSMRSAIKALRLQQDPSASAKLLDVIDNDLLRLERATAPVAQAARGLTLTQLTPKVPVIIEGLPTGVGDIVSAFLSNAIQRCAWGDEIRIWTRIQDHMVLVVVEDTGPPLPEDVSETLFGSSDLALPAGKNLECFTEGLAGAGQIIAAHSGVIRAEPVQPTGADPAFGARFLFGLPVHDHEL
jgi:two-component system sensor histidine kinase ChvG